MGLLCRKSHLMNRKNVNTIGSRLLVRAVYFFARKSIHKIGHILVRSLVSSSLQSSIDQTKRWSTR